MMPFLDFGDDEEPVELKFDECGSCENLGKSKTCKLCECGEFFNEIDPAGIDTLFI